MQPRMPFMLPLCRSSRTSSNGRYITRAFATFPLRTIRVQATADWHQNRQHWRVRCRPNSGCRNEQGVSLSGLDISDAFRNVVSPFAIAKTLKPMACSTYEQWPGTFHAVSRLAFRRRYSSNGTPNQKAHRNRERRKRRRYTPLEDIEIVDMHQQGYSWASIAQKLGRDKESARSRYKSYLQTDDNISAPLRSSTASSATPAQRNYTAEDDAMLLQLRENGMNLQGIARKLGRSPASIFSRYQWSLREGASGIAFHKDKARQADTLGRKLGKSYTVLERLTVVYLRSKVGMNWFQIAHQFPDRNVVSLKSSWHNRWKAMYADLVDDDPRHWEPEKLRKVMAMGEVRKGALDSDTKEA